MQRTFWFGEITSFSRADNATIGFIVEPGEYNPDTVLLISGYNGSSLMSFQSFILIPYKNKLGSNDGEECIAITSPV